MAGERPESGELPTQPVTSEQRVILVESLQVTWKTLQHLRDKGMLKPGRDGTVSLRAADGCCKPDGGTCCVNAKAM